MKAQKNQWLIDLQEGDVVLVDSRRLYFDEPSWLPAKFVRWESTEYELGLSCGCICTCRVSINKFRGCIGNPSPQIRRTETTGEFLVDTVFMSQQKEEG